MSAGPQARSLFEEALRAHDRRETARSIELALQAASLDPGLTEALEHAATLLVTRRHRYAEGLAHLARAVELRPDDAGLWYTLGWCSEFAAHELRRRPVDAALDPRALYQQAKDAFERCLALHPGGKLEDDARDLFDHVENELASM